MNSFEAKGKKWEYIPNSIKGNDFFEGKYWASKRVKKLLGKVGLKKVDGFLKNMSKVKKSYLGENSYVAGSSSIQYFTTKPKEQEDLGLPCIFRTNEIIICHALIYNNYFNPKFDNYLILKPDSFDDDEKPSVADSNKDYLIYTIDDTRKFYTGDGKEIDWEWKRIQDEDEDIIAEIYGDELE